MTHASPTSVRARGCEAGASSKPRICSVPEHTRLTVAPSSGWGRDSRLRPRASLRARVQGVFGSYTEEVWMLIWLHVGLLLGDGTYPKLM